MEIYEISELLGFTGDLTGIDTCDLSLLQEHLIKNYNLIITVTYGYLSDKFSFEIYYSDDFYSDEYIYKNPKEALKAGLIKASEIIY